MSRYGVAIDLAQLPAPDAVIPPSFEAIVGARKADIVARVAAVDPVLAIEVGEVLALESEPMTKLTEAGGYFSLLMHQRINEAVRGVMLPTARGADLEDICARLNVKKMVIRPADPTTNPPTPALVESDAALIERYQLALEAFSSAGPYGAYHFFARTAHPHVKHTAVYGPESNLVDPGEVLIVVLSHIGDGTPTAQVLDAVRAALAQSEDVRPLTDHVTVVGATVTHYTVGYRLLVARGADPALLAAESQKALAAYTAARHKVGAPVVLTALDGAAHGDRINVERITRLSPASEVDPGPQGAAFCDAIDVTYEIAGDQ